MVDLWDKDKEQPTYCFEYLMDKHGAASDDRDYPLFIAMKSGPRTYFTISTKNTSKKSLTISFRRTILGYGRPSETAHLSICNRSS